jgi:hypothetical protein
VLIELQSLAKVSALHNALGWQMISTRMWCVMRARAQAASLRAHKDYEAGEEVFDSYGPSLSPPDLFLDWGFVDAPYLQFADGDDGGESWSAALPNDRVGVDPRSIGR